LGATAEGTEIFQAEALKRGVTPSHFRDAEGLRVSSIGLGTYLGDGDDPTDELYRRAVIESVKLGSNVIDTAINYRCQRSERTVGSALAALDEDGFSREQILVCTKGGFIPFDSEPPANARDYLNERFLEPGILRNEDIVAGNAIAPSFLKHQLARSLDNLGVEIVDVYYLHNPETQLRGVDRKTFRSRLRDAFGALEELADERRIAFYGAATWTGFRSDVGSRESLSLHELVAVAREVAGEKHRFRFVQAPLNLGATEIFSEPNQQVGEAMVSLCRAAEHEGVHLVCSASLAQGVLQSGLPDWLGMLFRGLDTDAQRALQFVRSAPGVKIALVGMKSLEHVRENLAIARLPPVSVEDFLKLFEVESDSSQKKL
jgi:aryl-alcohol dehydrogenase-like predicted oxidoreductase